MQPTTCVNTAAFSDPGCFAESGLRNPFASNENLALAKKFFFGKKATGELRMEFFNVLNRMQICGPTDQKCKQLAGFEWWELWGCRASCQTNDPRQGQAYFRVNF